MSEPLGVGQVASDAIRFSGLQVDALVRSWAADPAANRGVALTADNDGYMGLFSDDTPQGQLLLLLRFADS
ncbi:hypothetical protein ACF3MZ_06055 [Paenibacillaceae bacterium WGS1546]|uniref:hypothetical protein n=1 Tax=Cohnella sp. WGS1546 TaxID=3366810 RepID=UPI00372D1596